MPNIFGTRGKILFIEGESAAKQLYRIFISCLLWLVCLLIGCAPDPQMRTWSTSQDYDKKFKNLMIMGLVNNVGVRSAVENEVVEASISFGLDATNSMSMFPPELGKPFEDTEKLKARLREKGFDAILTVAIIDVRAQRYVGPSTTYEPLVFYDRFGNYYYKTYATVYQPGYFAQNTSYYLETNLYELKIGNLVWSGISRAFVPEEFESFLPAVSRALFKELYSESIIIGRGD